MEVTSDLHRPPGERVVQVSIGGNTLEAGRDYSVVTSSFLAKGYSGFESFAQEKSARCWAMNGT